MQTVVFNPVNTNLTRSGIVKTGANRNLSTLLSKRHDRICLEVFFSGSDLVSHPLHHRARYQDASGERPSDHNRRSCLARPVQPRDWTKVKVAVLQRCDG